MRKIINKHKSKVKKKKNINKLENKVKPLEESYY